MQMGLTKQWGVGMWAGLLWPRTDTGCRLVWPSGFVCAASCVTGRLPAVCVTYWHLLWNENLKNVSIVPYRPRLCSNSFSQYLTQNTERLSVYILLFTVTDSKSYRFLCHIVPCLFMNPYWLDIPIQCDRPNLCMCKVGAVGYSFNFMRTIDIHGGVGAIMRN